MPDGSVVNQLAEGRAARLSTRVAFFVCGIAMAAWAALVPFVKAQAGLEAGPLGLLLLCFGIGSIVTMPVAGAMAGRFGCRRVILVSGAAVIAVLPVLATAASVWVLAPALLLFGAAFGTFDVSMNIQAILVERASRRAIMSGFHGSFSFGGLVGATGIAGAYALGAPPWVATLGVMALLAGLLLAAGGFLLPYGTRRQGPAFAWPRGEVLGLGLLCFAAFLSEGAVLDWGGVFLTGQRGLAPEQSGIGYAAFSVTMTLGRFTGDRLVQRFGGRALVVAGGLFAAGGFLLVALLPGVAATLLGFSLVGVGLANVAPVLFTRVGRQKAMPENVAVPALTTLGYAGLLAGPGIIGLVAQVAGLPAGFLLVALLLLAVAMGGQRLRP